MQVLCQYCQQRDDKEEMYDSGRKSKRYFHHKCWQRELKEQEVKKQDKIEKDELNKTLMRIHNINVVTPYIWQEITDLRFGNAKLKDKYGNIKRQKKGIPFGIINSAYLRSEKWINKARAEKSFNSITQEMLYCYKIMLNSVNDCYKDSQRKIKQEEQMNANVEYIENSIGVDKPKFKKTENKMDISEFIED